MRCAAYAMMVTVSKEMPSCSAIRATCLVCNLPSGPVSKVMGCIADITDRHLLAVA